MVTSLKRKAAVSTLWSMSQFGSDQVFNFIIYIILARLLSPKEFGVFILASIMVEVGKIIAGGLSSAIVRAPAITEKLVDTIFWTNVSLATVIALLYWSFSNSIAHLLGSQSVAGVVAVLGLTIPVGALGTTHMALNLRQFGHRALAIRSVACGIFGGALALLAAFSGWGIWALVVQRLTVEVTGVVVSWLSYRWRPGIAFSFETLRVDGALGLANAGSQTLTLALARGQDVIVSHFFPVGAVGVFRNGSKLAEMLSQGIVGPMTGVAVPTLMRLRDDNAAFLRAFVGMIQTSAIVMIPAVVGTAVTAPDLVMALFGPKWLESVGVMQALSLVAVPLAVSLFFMSALLVLGRSKLIMQLMIGHVGFALAVCILAAPHGLVAIIVAFAINEHLWLAMRCWVLKRLCRLDPRSIVIAILPSIVSALIMAAVLLIVRRVLYSAPALTTADAAINLLIFIPIGVTIYGASLFAVGGRGFRTHVLTIARRGMGRPPSYPPPDAI